MGDGSKFLLFAGIIGLGIFVVYQTTKKPTLAPVTYRPVYTDEPQYARPTYRPVQEEIPEYQNHEEITFPDGFDPETLMPRKIVVIRNYKMRVK